MHRHLAIGGHQTTCVGTQPSGPAPPAARRAGVLATYAHRRWGSEWQPGTWRSGMPIGVPTQHIFAASRFAASLQRPARPVPSYGPCAREASRSFEPQLLESEFRALAVAAVFSQARFDDSQCGCGRIKKAVCAAVYYAPSKLYCRQALARILAPIRSWRPRLASKCTPGALVSVPARNAQPLREKVPLGGLRLNAQT